MSAGWGRFQEEGAGPDWLAAEEPAPQGGAEARQSAAGGGSAGAGASGSDDGAPGWAAAAEPGADAGPSGWASLTEPAEGRRDGSVPKPSERGGSAGAERKQRSSGFGESRRGGFAPAKKAAASKKPASNKNSGWSSRRKDRDPADADKPKPPPSRETLEQRAKNILTYHLGRQMQTRSQLADRLRKKEIPDDIAEAALDRFEELHLLNDTDYAETFVRSRHNERGLAKRALGYELRKRGIDDETAAEALSTLDEDQEAVTARRLVDSRLRATRGLEPQVRTRRLVGMLARKGYSSSVAFRAVKEALADEGQEIELDDPGFD
ncbi:regulatory protein RecX [Catenulispora pinisilvae]|uniref:regulatory protein RecX n=1 Tax=Catenulispora pinisilvae TaxID=2705253 RepID=UPI00189258D8|nr:regulatory protein RecX [Catenulispora pinisilvae]